MVKNWHKILHLGGLQLVLPINQDSKILMIFVYLETGYITEGLEINQQIFQIMHEILTLIIQL